LIHQGGGKGDGKSNGLNAEVGPDFGGGGGKRGGQALFLKPLVRGRKYRSDEKVSASTHMTVFELGGTMRGAERKKALNDLAR